MKRLDPTRMAHGLLYVRALGLRRAVKATGINVSTLVRWRRIAGDTSRRPNPGFTGKGRLSLEAAREIRAARAAGEKQEAVAERYGVHFTTISKIERGLLYPDPTPFEAQCEVPRPIAVGAIEWAADQRAERKAG